MYVFNFLYINRAWNLSHGRVLSLTEMKQHAPDVLDVLATIAVPEIKEHAAEQKIPPLCTAYGIFMNPRWKELSLIQKVNGTVSCLVLEMLLKE